MYPTLWHQKLSPVKFRPQQSCEQLKVLARFKIACQAFFEIIFWRGQNLSEMTEAFRFQDQRSSVCDKFNYLFI